MSRASSSGSCGACDPATRRWLHLRDLGAGWARARARDCERWTPVWEPGPGGVLLDLTGTERLHGPGDDGPARVCRDAAARWGALAAGAAASRLAATIASACAARWDGLRRGPSLLCVPTGSIAAFLAPFPVEVLRDRHAGAVGVLQRSGVRALGDLQAVPLPLLASLLGAEGPLLAALARGEDRAPPPAPGAVAGAAVVAVSLARPLSGRLALGALLRATSGRALLAVEEGPGSRQWWELRARRGGVWQTARLAPPGGAAPTFAGWLGLVGGLWRRLPPRRTGVTALRLVAGPRALRARALQGDLFAGEGAGRLAAAWRRAGARRPGALHLAGEELLAGWGAVWHAGEGAEGEDDDD